MGLRPGSCAEIVCSVHAAAHTLSKLGKEGGRGGNVVHTHYRDQLVLNMILVVDLGGPLQTANN